MAKKKKKVSSQFLKQKEAEHRKLFSRKLKEFFVACNRGELYHLIDEPSMDRLYVLRYHPPQIELEEGVHFTKDEIQKLKVTVHHILRNKYFIVPTTENKMSYYDYMTVVFDARTIIRPTTTFNFSGIQQMVSEMQPIFDELYSEESLAEKLEYVCSILTMCLSEIDKKYYYVECDIAGKDPKVFKFTYRIGAVPSQLIHVPFDGLYRPAFQLGWLAGKQYFPITLTAEQLALNPEQYPDPLLVYIQSHALVRLKERIDVFDVNYYTTTTLTSLLDPEIIKTGKNSYLIAYKLHRNKVGYFKSDLIDGNIIIRTFLLLTNCGTPEELKLRQLTGLSKADYDFLNLGKLSTLVNADFHKNEQTIKLLEEAGFKSILDYARIHVKDMDHKIKLSDRFLDYIQPDYETYNLPEGVEKNSVMPTLPLA